MAVARDHSPRVDRFNCELSQAGTLVSAFFDSCGYADYAFNAAASFDALAVLSQVNSGSFRPKCPPDEVLL